MAKAIPKWVQERLSRIWKKYDSKELTFEMIEKVLSPMDDRNTISVFLNELKRAEWIEVKLSENDLRKRVYIFKEPNIIMKEIQANEN